MRTARTEILALILSGVLGVMLAACAAKQSAKTSGTSEPPTGRDTSGAATGSPEVQTFDDQIAHDMAQLGLDLPTDNDVISASVSHSAPALPMSSHIAETCPAAPGGGACSDVCTLADSICHNAGRICELAEELGDDYATQRCTSGKLSCERATDRCCGCE